MPQRDAPPNAYPPPASARRLGLIVNPIAGMGGRVALRGTDGEALAMARQRGAVPLAAHRAARALASLALPPGSEILTAGGAMGEAVAVAAGLRPVVVTDPPADSRANDTQAAAAAMAARGVALILFAGGDGTARDVFAAVGRRVPMLGVPTGVKMHAAVFATTPENAGRVAAAYLTDPATELRDGEVADGDEALLPSGRIATRLFGAALVPFRRGLIQQAKMAASNADADLLAACAEIAATLEPGCLYLFGPGTTTRQIMARLGFDGTLLGVDAVLDGALIGRDLTEADILRLIAGRPARIVAGVVGGQGFLFGRGNQQFSPAVLRQVGRDRIAVVASLDKLAMLDGGALHADTGDLSTDAMLRGHIRVQTGPGRAAICRILS